MAAHGRNGIGQAVGVGQPNDPADVRRLQHLLNERQVHGGERLAEDGSFGPRTTMRLVEYQRDAVGMSRPDGVADPHGPTMRSLSRAPVAEVAHGRVAASDANEHVSDYVASHPVVQPHETAKTKAWIEQALPAAWAAQERWGVPASVTLAQGALESAWGTTHPGGEYFGVKGKSPDGKSVSLSTHEEKGGRLHGETDSFRSYGSLAESADDYGRFLATNERYRAAFDHKDDGHRFIHEIAKAGYATDTHYESKVRSIIDHHDLTQYDNGQEQRRVSGAAAAATAPAPAASRATQATAQDAATDNGAAQALGPASIPATDHRALWMAMARGGQEAAAASKASLSSTSIAGLGFAPAADDPRASWLLQAQAGREAAQAEAAAVQAQQTPGTTQGAQTPQTATPTIRLRQ